MKRVPWILLNLGGGLWIRKHWKPVAYRRQCILSFMMTTEIMTFYKNIQVIL